MVWMGLGLVTILFFLVYGNFVQDDAYITYRFARNIAQGKGFVYNPGEWVLGTTTPLYTLLLSAGAWVTKLDVTQIGLFLCLISLWISSGILYEIGAVHDRGIALAAAVLYLTNPFLPHFNGMESYFLILLLLLTLFTYQRKQLFGTAILGGLLILVRYEMVFLVLTIAIFDILQKKKLPFWLLPGSIPVAAWFLYAYIKFGSPIPQSASAKLVADRIPFLVGFGLYQFRFINENVLYLIFLLFACLGAWILVRSKGIFQNYAIILMFSLIYIAVVAFLAGSFPWYYAPIIPGLSIVAGIGVTHFSRSAVKAFQIRSPYGTLLHVAIILSLSLGQMLSWFSNYVTYRGAFYDSRFSTYRQVSDWLIANAYEDQSIALLEIGFIGYFTNMEVVDLYGLISPRLFQWLDDGTEQTLIQSIRLYAVDFILMPTSKTSESSYLAEHPQYRVVKTFNGYHLYERTQP